METQVKDIAYRLAEAITDLPEYREYTEARHRLEQDRDNYAILEMYRHRQWEVHLESMLGKDTRDLEEDLVEEMTENLKGNQAVNDFLLAEYRFTRILAEVQEILISSVEGLRPAGENGTELH